MRTNWEDYYQVRSADLVAPSQRPQTRPTLRDSRTAIKPQAPQRVPQQVPPQEKNIRSGDYI